MMASLHAVHACNASERPLCDAPHSYGNIYLSDAEGLKFALSLRNNKRDAQGRCDFEKVQGIEGIYITSTLSPGLG